MKDIQSQRDYRRINIKKVGVKNISYPITVLDKARKVQRTIATVNMYVNLPHRFKGTHMSRFIEILNRFHGGIDMQSFHRVLEEMKERLEAQAAHIEIDFPYFLKKQTNQTNAIGIDEYRCKMHASLDREYDLSLEITVPISPPLPDQSNEALPRSSGHWGFARICLRFRHFIWIEDLIRMVEDVIRDRQRSDISWYCKDFLQTSPPSAMHAGKPRQEVAASGPSQPGLSLSVEKITKSLGEALAGHRDIRWFSVTVENLARGCSVFSSLEHTVAPGQQHEPGSLPYSVQVGE